MAVDKKMYTADQMCNMADFLVDNIFVKFGGVYFIKLLESLSKRIVLHFSLTCSSTHMKVTVWLEVATGNLLGHWSFNLCYRYIDQQQKVRRLMSKTFTHPNEMLKRLIGWMIKKITLTFIIGNNSRLYAKL